MTLRRCIIGAAYEYLLSTLQEAAHVFPPNGTPAQESSATCVSSPGNPFGGALAVGRRPCRSAVSRELARSQPRVDTGRGIAPSFQERQPCRVELGSGKRRI